MNTEVEFVSGTNGLMGTIGSGKTSLLDAICFAFFGNFPTLQSRKIKLDDVIMSKPTIQKEAEVSVEFVIDGKKYRVTRRIERGKGTTFAEIREGNKILESPNSKRVTEIVEKILKVNYELFTRSIYSEQNSLDYFLTLPRGQRMKKIDELLAIDKFENVRSNCIYVINKIADRKFGIESLLSKVDLEKLKEELKEQKEFLNRIELKEQELSLQLKSLEEEIEKKEKEFSEIKKIKTELDEVEKNLSGINKAMEELQESLKRLGEVKVKDEDGVQKIIEEINENLENLEGNYKEKVEKYEKIYEKFSEINSNLKFLKEERLKELEEKINEKLEKKKKADEIEKIVGKDYERKLEEKKKIVENLWNEAETMKIKIDELRKQIDELSSISGKCPICEREISDELKEKLVKEKMQHIKKFEDEVKKKIEEKTVIEKEVEEIENYVNLLKEILNEIKDLDELKNKFKDAKMRFEELGKERVNVEEEINLLQNEIKALEEKIEKMKAEKIEVEKEILKLKEYQSIIERMKSLDERRNTLSQKEKELKNYLTLKNLEEIEKELREALMKKSEIKANLSSLQESKVEKEKRKKELEKEIETFEKEKKKVENMENIIKQLKLFAEAISKTQLDLRKEFVSTVNYTMNKIWQDLYPYQDFIGIKLEVEEGDYVLKLQERSGEWKNVEGIASGGERSLAALALRVAFALVLTPQLKWLILDEPTANLDKKSIQTFASILKNSIIDFIDQTFIITHQEELAEGITGYLYRFERNKAKDEPTRVIRVV